MERGVLNAYPRLLEQGGQLISQFLVETTALPTKIQIKGSDKDPGLLVTLENLKLIMAPDQILVTDGLVNTVSLEEPRDPAVDAREASSRVSLKFDLEYPVMPQVDWFLPEPEDEGRIQLPYVVQFTFSRESLSNLLKGRRIAIDPGHGGKDPGVKGPVNLLEKNVVLEISLLLASLLSNSGAKVFLSRDKDTFISRIDRVNWAREVNPDILLEIHTSHSDDPLIQEYHLKAKSTCPESTALASFIKGSLEQRLGITVSELEPMEKDPSYPPTVLVEPLCLSHFVDEANFRAPLFRKRIAQALYNGIVRYFKNKEEGEEKEKGFALLRASREEFSVELSLPAQNRLVMALDDGVIPDTARRLWEKVTLLRVRTHLITEKDNIVDVVARYTRGIVRKGDLVGVSESVVAITQGRAIPPEAIKPGFLAKFLSRFAHPDASVSAERSMQKAIEIAGTPRILLASAAALIGKILGIHGLFFRVAGHEVAEIDDSGGTMPPYDRHVILGPENPDKVARDIWKKTGLWALVLDTNDKGAVDILGSSFPLSPQKTGFIKSILRKNPFGNDDQKTPIVVIKLR